jgi:dTDP-4-dehydrorhamnose 3,5-epimerase
LSIKLDIEKSKIIKGVYLITPTVFNDNRGSIWTSYLHNKIDSLLPKGVHFIHDKFSESKQNVLRGIHGDNKTWKLVTSVYGDIYQVVVDMRPSSDTYLKWESFSINKKNQLLVLIPPGVGNAYCVTSKVAVYYYKLAYNNEYYDAEEQFTIRWDDERLGINWPTGKPELSQRDKK